MKRTVIKRLGVEQYAFSNKDNEFYILEVKGHMWDNLGQFTVKNKFLLDKVRKIGNVYSKELMQQIFNKFI